MARVFISHAAADQAAAELLHRWLSIDGHEVFLDVEISDGLRVGEQWQQRLHERLRWADAMVCVITAQHVASAWCAAEVGIAESRGSAVLPVRAEPGVVHPLLDATQHVDLVADPEAARARLGEALRRVDAAGGSGWSEGRSPFPGLRPFGGDEHRVFFGRTGDLRELVGRLRSPAERAEAAALLLVGPSGCGKSSLVRAGLVPTIVRESGWWALTPIWPGSDPVAELAHELAAAARALGMSWSLPEVRRVLDRDGLRGLVAELLLAAPPGHRTRLLIVVDQFEELLTLTPAGERARFAGLLGSVLGGPVQVVATLRPDLLDALLTSPELAGLATRTVTLRPLGRDSLHLVVSEPARVAGIAVDPELVARLVADTDGGEALPLLAYTLAQLADGVDRGGRLSAERYDQLDGVHGALTRQADVALDEAVTAGGRTRDEVIGSLLRLVAVDERGHPTRWRVRRDQLPGTVTTELEPFLARRLLTTDVETDPDATGDGEVVVLGVAHEAFLSVWAPLARAIADSSAALRARRAIEHAATVWNAGNRPTARLWERGQLTSALTDTGAHLSVLPRRRPHAPDDPGRTDDARPGRRWWPTGGVLVVERVTLSPQARDFLRAGIRWDRRRRVRAVTVLGSLLAVAVTAAVVAVVLLHTTQDQQRLAVARLLVSEAEAARNTDQRTALLLGETAQHLHLDEQTRDSLIRTLLTDRYRGTLIGHTDAVDSVAFSPDGRTMVTASYDDTAIVWDLHDAVTSPRGHVLSGHTSRVGSVAFSPDGHTLATGSDDGTVILWNLSDPDAPRQGHTLIGHGKTVRSVAFSPDGRTLATSSADGAVILWNLSAPDAPLPGTILNGRTGPVNSVAFSPDGRTLATGSADRTVILWDLRDPAMPHRALTPSSHTGPVDSVAFSPDGQVLATGGDDGTVILWDLSRPDAPRPGPILAGHADFVKSVAFAPDGRTLATAGTDNTVILWDLRDPTAPRQGLVLAAHTSPAEAVAFSPDGHSLATGSADGSVILWASDDLLRPDPIGPGRTGGVYSVAYSPGTGVLAVGNADGTVTLRDLSGPATRRRPDLTLPGHVGPTESMAFSPDGHTLAAAGDDRTVIVWDVRDPAAPRRGPTLPGPTESVTFSPDGRTLSTADYDGTVTLWDLSGPATHHHPVLVLPGHTGPAGSVAFSPDGRTLATAGDGGTVTLWDLSGPGAPHPRSVLKGHTSLVNSVAFSPDGRTVATGGDDRTVILWDLSDPDLPRPGPVLGGYTGSVSSVAFSPDGHTLATAVDRTVVLWDLLDPDAAHSGPVLTGHTDAVRSVTFSADGRTLVTADDDSVILWNDMALIAAALDDPLRNACTITRGGMSPTEWTRFVPDVNYEDSCSPGRLPGPGGG